MLVVHVFVSVKKENLDEFIEATKENAMNSINEPGVARFDFSQQQHDPTKFCLVEIYKTVEDAGKHKATAHYAKWRDTVVDMMAEPRYSVKYNNILPTDENWA